MTKRASGKFKRKIERNLRWLIRGIIVLSFLSGSLFALSVEYYMSGIPAISGMMICACFLGFVFIWHANISLKHILEYEGKVEFFIKFTRDVLKPIKEMEDAEKDKGIRRR